MRKLTILFFLLTEFLNAQSDSTFVDTKYLEDQFYANLTYIKLLSLPEPIFQTGFSYGINFGFIKDLPVNEKRNIGLGLGLGYSWNTYYFKVREYMPLQDNSESTVVTNNKVNMHNVEIPVEFRFRTSTPKKYKFWRIYPGFKFSYAFAFNPVLRQKDGLDTKKIIKVNRFQYGPTISIGYNKWNLHVYYGLSKLFSNADTSPYNFGIHEARIGLIFYIL